MGALRALVRRVRGDDVAALQEQVTALRAVVESINHEVVQLHAVLHELNHDVRAGSGDVLPMFLGYAQRFRTDADTMVGVTELIDRQLAAITAQVDRLAEIAGGAPGTS